jgi:chloramphenicol-sensitive protein RarD
VETTLATVPAALTLGVLHAQGSGTFVSHGLPHALLLASCGVATAIPLLLFAAAARRVPLSTVGLLQYLTPSMQLLIGVFVYGEAMPPGRLVGFAIVWLALAVFSVDSLRHARSGGHSPIVEVGPAGL